MENQYPDQDWIQQIKQDDEQAMDKIFRAYYTFICRAVYRVVPDSVLTEDIAQEVLLEIWRKRHSLNIKSSLKAYLRRSAINKALNYIRDNKVKLEDEEKMPVLESKMSGAQQQLEANDLQALINKTIDELPERCRMVFVLSRFEDMTYREIGEHMNISIKTVENQMSKALKYLTASLSPYLQIILLLMTIDVIFS